MTWDEFEKMLIERGWSEQEAKEERKRVEQEQEEYYY